jgi:transcriptional regulator with XRE-family HTH domain
VENDQPQPTVPPVQLDSQVPSPETRFGQRIRQEREARGWTQAQVAARLAEEGIRLHPSAIAKIEDRRSTNRPRMIRLDEAKAFATIFGATVDDLIQPKDEGIRLFFMIRELLAPYAAHHARAQAVLSVVRGLAADRTGAVTDGERAIVQSYLGGVELAAAASANAVKIIEHTDRLLDETATADEANRKGRG